MELFETPVCPICGAPGLACQPAAPRMELVKTTAREPMSEYRSKERVYEKDEEGVLRLKYAEGDPIPDAEARRQGLVRAKARAKPPEDKSPRKRPRTK